MSARAPDDQELIEVVLSLLGPLRLRYCPLRPTPRQEAFLLLPDKEVFFGGAAGGGKSVALLMAALQYADVPGYHALLLRQSLTELKRAGGLIELAHDWLAGTKAQWSGETHTWRFAGPGRSGAGGASLAFGYLSDPSDPGRYAGTSYSFLGFDELTSLEEQLYRRMFRVLRQPTTGNETSAPDGTSLRQVPVRIRATSNPGGVGHSWVKDRFVDTTESASSAVFMRSQLADNPHLNSSTYTATLMEMPNAERERLLHGDWEIPDDGELFQRDWFPLIEPHHLPATGTRAVRYWDLAATEPNSRNRDPDWTVGLRLEYHRESGVFYITDIVRDRLAPGAVERLVATTAKRDGRNVPIYIEQEPGAAGVQAVQRYTRHVLVGYSARSVRATGDKATRARPVAAAAENGYIRLVHGRHTRDFHDELSAFPHGRHDDCVDALAGAHTALTRTSGRTARTSVPRGTIGAPRQRPHRIHTRTRQQEDRATAHLAIQLGAIAHQPPPAGIVTSCTTRHAPLGYE